MTKPTLTTSAGAPISDNQNSASAGPRGPLLMQDYQLLEKLAHQNRERIAERPVHAKGWGAFGTLTITHDITRFSKAKVFSQVGKKTEMLKMSKKFEQLERDLGFPKAQTLIGSIGAPESRMEINYRFDNIAALEAVWAKLGDPRMADYQKDMAAYVVPGSHRWDIFRIHEA